MPWTLVREYEVMEQTLSEVQDLKKRGRIIQELQC